MGKIDRRWSTHESLDQTRTLNLTIDPTKNDGQPPPAVMISRTVQAVVRRCPSLSITLTFAHCQCLLSPVSALETENFPGVTKLIVYVGEHDPEDSRGNDREAKPCQPNAKFWRPFVNGMTFPDCKKLEVRHYWATVPPGNASLDLMKVYPPYDPYDGRPLYGGPRGSPSGVSTTDQHIGSTAALKRFQSIVLECPPEINSPLLMQLLGNPDAVAVNLTNLELRFCNLSYETYSKLLYHAPPNIQRFVLLCCDTRGFNHHHSAHYEKIPHLCPLLRAFSRRLIHLEFGAQRICPELFLDDVEKQSLKNHGIETAIGFDGGAIDNDFGDIDSHAIRETVRGCRKQKRAMYRNDRIREAITAAKSTVRANSSSNSLFGSSEASDANKIAIKCKRDTEALLDEEEEKRSRLIKNSKTPWSRRAIAYHGLCNSETWAEMQIGAEMEEKGIEWVLVSKSRLDFVDSGSASVMTIIDKHMQSATQHSNGKPPIDINMKDALCAKFDFVRGAANAASTP